MPNADDCRGLWGAVFSATAPRPTPNMDAFHAERTAGRCGICDAVLVRKRRAPTVCQVDTGRDCTEAYQLILCADYQHRARMARRLVIGALVAWMGFTKRQRLPVGRPHYLEYARRKEARDGSREAQEAA